MKDVQIIFKEVTIARVTYEFFNKSDVPEYLKGISITEATISQIKELHHLLDTKGNRLKGNFVYIRYTDNKQQSLSTWLQIDNLKKSGWLVSKYQANTISQREINGKGLLENFYRPIDFKIICKGKAELELTIEEFNFLTRENQIIDFPQPEFR